jgi:hypothetical protein
VTGGLGTELTRGAFSFLMVAEIAIGQSPMATLLRERLRLHGVVRSFWRSFKLEFFNTYRPELHYMRGPGPKWKAKYRLGPNKRSPSCCRGLWRSRGAKAMRFHFAHRGPLMEELRGRGGDLVEKPSSMSANA